MRSAPTLKIWMTPLASVAMLEKLALLKIALWRAPVCRSASDRLFSFLKSTVRVVGMRPLFTSSGHDLRRVSPEHQLQGTNGSKALAATDERRPTVGRGPLTHPQCK